MKPHYSYLSNFEEAFMDDSPGICRGCHFNCNNGTLCSKTGKWCYLSKQDCADQFEGPPRPTQSNRKLTEQLSAHGASVKRDSFVRVTTSKGKPVVCIDTNQEFSSISHAARALCLNTSTLWHHLKGHQPKCSGYTFRYKDDANADPNG